MLLNRPDHNQSIPMLKPFFYTFNIFIYSLLMQILFLIHIIPLRIEIFFDLCLGIISDFVRIAK
jgi:hypothetical protein